MEKSKALEMIAAISNANGISGFEEEVVAEILPYAKTVGETSVDRMRNVFIRRNRRVMRASCQIQSAPRYNWFSE